ncbi:hypothetical protein ACO0LG_12490 [Undibacterium sp. Ji42W]|uniref:hypothetical protein n=1 Tax=Undibacterium sp. Ji42W TaxID=3413039 RepID=UPI003BF0ED69
MMTSNDNMPLSNAGIQPNYPKHPLTRRGDFTGQPRKKPFLQRWNHDINSVITTGATIGMVVGSVLGMVNATLAVVISPFFIPGLDLLVTQPLEAAVIGAVLGILFGAIVGSLLGWGVSSQSNEQIETDVESHASFCPIQEDADKDRVEAWKEQHGECANI